MGVCEVRCVFSCDWFIHEQAIMGLEKPAISAPETKYFITIFCNNKWRYITPRCHVI